MSLTASLIKNKEPLYFHRGYQNDFSDKPYQYSLVDQGKRLALVSLPFVSLYKPISSHLALGMGALRTVTNLGHLAHIIYHGKEKRQEIPLQLLHTSIAAIALAGTIFSHPIGMVVTTIQDLAIEAAQLKKHLEEGDYEKAIGSCISIINNSLYLALTLYGGIELTIASLAMQILVGIYHSQAEFKNGNYLESSGHLAMALIRTNQMIEQARILQIKWACEKAAGQCKSVIKTAQDQLYQNIFKDSAIGISEAVKNGANVNLADDSKTPLLMAVLMKKSNAIGELIKLGANVDIVYKGHPLSHYAIKLGDLKSAFLLVKSGCRFDGPINEETKDDIMACVTNFVESPVGHTRQEALEFAQELIDKGYNLNDSHYMRNAIRYIITWPDRTEELLALVIKNGANVNQLINWVPENKYYTTTPLFCAIEFRNKRAAKMLLDAGANINQKASPHQLGLMTPLDYAVKYQSSMVEFLLENGASL